MLHDSTKGHVYAAFSKQLKKERDRVYNGKMSETCSIAED